MSIEIKLQSVEHKIAEYIFFQEKRGETTLFKAVQQIHQRQKNLLFVQQI